MGNALSKTVCKFWLNRVTFGIFQAFKTDFRLMVKSSISVKPNLPL